MSGSTCHCGGARGCSCIGMHMPWWCNTVLMYATASPVQAPIAYIADWLLSFWCSSIREARHPSLPPLFPPSLPHSLPPGQGRRNCYIYGHYGLDRSTFRPKKNCEGDSSPGTYIALKYVRILRTQLYCATIVLLRCFTQGNSPVHTGPDGRYWRSLSQADPDRAKSGNARPLDFFYNSENTAVRALKTRYFCQCWVHL